MIRYTLNTNETAELMIRLIIIHVLYCHVSSINKHKKVDHIDKSYDNSSTCLRCGQEFTSGGNQTFPLRSKIIHKMSSGKSEEEFRIPFSNKLIGSIITVYSITSYKKKPAIVS